MPEKNKNYEAEILRYGSEGEGIAIIDGMIIFVPYVLVGERVEIKVLSVKKRFGYGKIERILTPSPFRRLPRCETYYSCGGCELQHAEYSEQLRIKKKKIADCLSSFGYNNDFEIVPSSLEFGYRNKIALPVRKEEGKLSAGFYAPRSHRFVSHGECPLHSQTLNKFINSALHILDEAGISAYDEMSGKGYLRHIVARELEGSLCLTLVINSQNTSPLSAPAIKIAALCKNVSVYANVNTGKTNVVFGSKFMRLQGNTPIAKMCGIEIPLHPNSFFQINTPLAERIYNDVSELVRDEKIVDLYSGIGLTSNIFARTAKRVTAVEIIPEAVKNADELKMQCGNDGIIENICGDCAEAAPRVISHDCSVFLDPPRKGCDERVLSAISSASPAKIVYLSCNPATLARDINFLSTHGYSLVFLRGYDLFPQTKHVETLVSLCRK